MQRPHSSSNDTYVIHTVPAWCNSLVPNLQFNLKKLLSNGTYGAKEGVGMNNPYAIAVTEASNL